MQRRRPARRARPVVCAALTLCWLLLASCTWSAQEPGLFNQPAPVPSGSAEPTPTPGTTVGLRNPSLPTFGLAVWTTGDAVDAGDGSAQPILIAVHAVRRIAGGATVLDWSVTPLPTDRRPAGTPLPSSTDLGLSRFGEGDLNVFLVDAVRRRVYRPLTATGTAQLDHCLCTPVWLAQRRLVTGATTLLQATYPALPKDVDAVDVDITTVPVFSQVPVTPTDRVPRGPVVDLLGPAQNAPTEQTTRRFSVLGQRFEVSVDDVLAGRQLTSIQWRITALSDGRNLTTWPLGERPSRATYSDLAADGAALLGVGGRTLSSLAMTTRLRGLDQLECLCTDMRLWTAGLSRAGTSISVVTNVPALPADREHVDVGFPGLRPFTDVPVTPVPDATGLLLDLIEIEPKTYTYRMNEPPADWSVDQWPTPVPNARQLPGYRSTVDVLR